MPLSEIHVETDNCTDKMFENLVGEGGSYSKKASLTKGLLIKGLLIKAIYLLLKLSIFIYMALKYFKGSVHGSHFTNRTIFNHEGRIIFSGEVIQKSSEMF